MAKIEMHIINPHCVGINIGSRSHFVATGQGEKDVREFGAYAEDLVEICVNLKQHAITHVAMKVLGAIGKSECQAAHQYYEGVDLMEIAGVSHATGLSIMSEIVPAGFSEFPTSKHFTSWLRLAQTIKKPGVK